MQETELLVRVGGDDGVRIELLGRVWGMSVQPDTADAQGRENVARRLRTGFTHPRTGLHPREQRST